MHGFPVLVHGYLCGFRPADYFHTNVNDLIRSRQLQDGAWWLSIDFQEKQRSARDERPAATHGFDPTAISKWGLRLQLRISPRITECEPIGALAGTVNNRNAETAVP